MIRCFAIVVLLTFPTLCQAIDVQVTIKSVDDDGRLVFVGPDGRQRSAKVSLDAELLDADGKPLAGGLKSELLAAGAKVSLTVIPENNQPVVRACESADRGMRSPRWQSRCRSSTLRRWLH